MSLDKILSTDAIVNRCEQILQKKLSDKTLKVTILSRESDKAIFSIQTGKGAIQLIDDEISHKEVIVPFVQATNQKLYWLGFSIVFKKTSRSHFSLFHIGIRIFQGENVTQEKKKIFRAEWMIDANTGNHAQPHWHIHKSYADPFQKKEEAKFNEEDEVLEFGAESKTATQSVAKKDELKNFHFAMASRWHKKESHHNKISELNELVQWLEGCLDYINDQLNYIS